MGPSDLATYISMASGAVIILIYTIAVARKLKSLPDIGSVLSILIPGIAIPQGIYVCYLAFNPELTPCMAISPIFLFIGGLTIVWVSVTKVLEVFRGIRDPIGEGN